MTTRPSPAGLLDAWIARTAEPAGRDWLAGQIEGAADPARLGPALSFMPRRLGRTGLALTAADLASADRVRAGWDPSGWTLDEAGRVRLLLAAPTEGFPARLRQVLAGADLGESVATYKGLPLYPDPAALVPVATEGLRSAMRPVFESIAHANPFPADHVPQGAWNQMVLKALFIGSALAPIAGLDRRRNPDLAAMLLDYARERRAAGRPVSPELWRGIGRFTDAWALGELARLLATGSGPEQWAAALALAEAGPEAARLLDAAPDLAQALRESRLSWSDLASP